MTTQHFTAHGKYLGSRQVPNFLRDSTFGARPTYSVCYFCPQCADIWARLLVEGANYAQHWTANCAKHGDGRIDKESRFEWWPSALEPDWPEEALRYVLLVELKLFLEQGK